MAQIDSVRLPDGTTIRPTEWTSAPYWSTVEVGPATDQTLTFFSYSLGGDVPGSVGPRRATYEDTNVEGPGGIVPENEELIIECLSLEVFTSVQETTNAVGGYFDQASAQTGTQTDIYKPEPPENSVGNILYAQWYLNLRLRIANEKPLLDHPIGFFPPASGLCPVVGAFRVPDDPAAMTAVPQPMWGAQHGSPQVFDKRKLVTPHRVMPGQVWGVDLTFPEGALDLDFGADFGGRLVLRLRSDGLHKRPVA